ncbi:MAG: RnfABCDGE type electron transport complex subunit B, partial [Bacteroidales bacterium]
MSTSLIIYAALIVGSIGLIAAVILFFVSKAFRVIEDPRIDEVAEKLPGANCGGCGFAGCRALAEAIVKANSLNGLECPAGGSSVREQIATLLGLEATVTEAKIAVIRCNGNRENAPAKVLYDSAHTCNFAQIVFAGENACPFGCLGCGDCVSVCQFDAIQMDPLTKLPVVDENNCVGCGACVKICPRNIIEIRNKGKLNRRIF